jgi:hypothetical protein
MWGGIVVVAFVAAAAVVLYLRSSAQQTAVPDTGIERTIRAKFAADPDLSKCTVEARSQNGVVTLTGIVNKSSDRSTAARIVLQQSGVKTVVDNLLLSTDSLSSDAFQTNSEPASNQAGSAASKTMTGFSAANAGAIWFGFANGNAAQDRDLELRQNCGDFKRVYVPENVGNKFTDLCGHLGKTCVKVCDWEGTSFSCDSVSRGGQRDGTRVALCRGDSANIWTAMKSALDENAAPVITSVSPMAPSCSDPSHPWQRLWNPASIRWRFAVHYDLRLDPQLEGGLPRPKRMWPGR